MSSYLQNNKVKYSDCWVSTRWSNNGIYGSSNVNFITADGYNAKQRHTIAMNQQTGTSFTLTSVAYNSAPSLVVYNARPSFTCSNFIDITSNDSITFTVKFDNIVMRTYKYPLQQQYMNFYNLTDYIWYGQKSTIKSITISATSTKVLTLVKPPKLLSTTENPYMNNCKVIIY